MFPAHIPHSHDRSPDSSRKKDLLWLTVQREQPIAVGKAWQLGQLCSCLWTPVAAASCVVLIRKQSLGRKSQGPPLSDQSPPAMLYLVMFPQSPPNQAVKVFKQVSLSGAIIPGNNME